jgi:hypothetical protein
MILLLILSRGIYSIFKSLAEPCAESRALAERRICQVHGLRRGKWTPNLNHQTKIQTSHRVLFQAELQIPAPKRFLGFGLPCFLGLPYLLLLHKRAWGTSKEISYLARIFCSVCAISRKISCAIQLLIF